MVPWGLLTCYGRIQHMALCLCLASYTHCRACDVYSHAISQQAGLKSDWYRFILEFFCVHFIFFFESLCWYHIMQPLKTKKLSNPKTCQRLVVQLLAVFFLWLGVSHIAYVRHRVFTIGSVDYLAKNSSKALHYRGGFLGRVGWSFRIWNKWSTFEIL